MTTSNSTLSSSIKNIFIHSLKLLMQNKKIVSVILVFSLLAFSSTMATPASAANIFQQGFNEAISKGVDAGLLAPGADGDAVAKAVIERFADRLIALIAALALFAIVWGGVMYIVSFGNEQRSAQAKQIILYAIIGLLVAGTASLIVGVVNCAIFQAYCGTGAEIGQFVGLIMRIVQALMAPAAVLAFAALVYGGYMFIISGPSGDEKKASKGKQIILYAFLGLAIIGIAGIIVNAVIALINLT